MWGWVGSPSLSGRVALSLTSGESDEDRNRRMNNEVCKRGEEQDGIQVEEQDTQFSTDVKNSRRELEDVVEGRDGD